jgi:hypothetical protein
MKKVKKYRKFNTDLYNRILDIRGIQRNPTTNWKLMKVDNRDSGVSEYIIQTDLKTIE